jgi:tripartite ATP-independent transporter DctM subunit
MAVGVTAASSTIGSIIPPSITMVIYGGLTNTSVGQLFIGGLLPGLLIGFGMMALISHFARKDGLPVADKVSRSEFMALLKDAIPAMITPLIIIGGIVGGIYTPTEAAAFSAVYAYLISAFYYKTIRLSDLPEIFIDTLKLSCLSLFALAAASALGEFLGYYRINSLVAEFFAGLGGNKYLFMFVVVLLFLFIGTFMDAIPAMVLFVPVVYPTALLLGVEPVQMGIIVIITLSIGLITPPYGLCLLIAGTIGGLPLNRSFSSVLPYISVIILVLLAVIVCPFLLLV